MTSILSYLGQQKEVIAGFLRQFTESRRTAFADVNRWGPDLLDRLYEFASRGKMIRGALVILAESLFSSGKPAGARQGASTDAVRVAAALELVQSFLLIHDDIMDQDFLRRGRPSLFAQYSESLSTVAPDTEAAEARRFGESMAICAGDVAMLLAFELLAELDRQDERGTEIISLAAREISWVGVAQMSDVYHSATRFPASEEEILSVYRYKTGRYTFSLPLNLGAILGGAGPSDRARLLDLGEQLGLLFQIKDDDLGIWGSEAQTGKPVGSDIAEGKQTLHRLYLIAAVPESERERTSTLFGSGSSEAAAEVRDLLTAYGVEERVRTSMQECAERARQIISSLEGVGQSGQALLLELVEYNLERFA